MRNINKILVVILSLLFLGSIVVFVFAEEVPTGTSYLFAGSEDYDVNGSSSTSDPLDSSVRGADAVVEQYTPVSATSMTFKKFLIVGAGDNIPAVSFDYSIEAGSAVSSDTSDNTTMEIIPGVMPVSEADPAQSITISTTSFSNSDTTSAKTSVASGDIDVARQASDRASGLTAETGVEFETSKGEKYATKTATVTFTNIKFDEPGIYRYIIRETASASNTAKGIMNDNDSDRILDIYVVDNGHGVLEVSEYVLHTNASDIAIGSTMGSADVSSAGASLSDKTDGFTNEYGTKDLVFKKGVTGNQASRDKAFEFTVTVTGLSDTDTFIVSIADDNNENTTDGNASANSGTTFATRESNRNKTNVTSVTGVQLASGVKFYLKHAQSIAILGLPLNANYTVVEDAEDYKPTASVLAGYTDATTGVIGTVAGDNKAVKTSYQNERSGIVPTGIVLGLIPYLLFGLLGISFVVVVIVNYRYKSKYDNE